MENTLNIVDLKNEVNKQLGDAETFQTLLATTFKGLEATTAKRAFLEGRLRGFTLTDFLQKNVYAVPFGSAGYSLVTSIDYSRKVGQKSGIVGKSAPEYVDTPEGRILTCSITVKKKVEDYVGDFTATVYFTEYDTKKQQWASKPRTMIAKVAEMHALRMACPEELAQSYVEEEYQREAIVVDADVVDITDYSEQEAQLRAVKTIAELTTIWKELKREAKVALESVKDEMKAILTTENHEEEK